jgi:hypothetical protein
MHKPHRLQQIVDRRMELVMPLIKHTTGMSREDLTRDCLQQIRLWPGCETVKRVGILGEPCGGFSVHIIDYGLARKRLADRAILCILREKKRQYHLGID